ncbi:MAG: class I SAM-dependent methyltransferase [Desulfobacterales bacterium]
MKLFEKFIAPRITNWVCGHKVFKRQRKKVVPLASGRVLEIGFGTGLNIRFYDPAKVQHVWGLDPSAAMWKMADTADLKFGVEFLQASAERIPLDKGSADTILVTYTLCSVPNIIEALKDMRRVLKLGGELIFCEHGAAPDENVKKWQERLNPIWSKISGGCNLNRSIPTLLEQGGFKVRTLDTMYLPVWKPAAFNYWGTAD